MPTPSGSLPRRITRQQSSTPFSWRCAGAAGESRSVSRAGKPPSTVNSGCHLRFCRWCQTHGRNLRCTGSVRRILASSRRPRLSPCSGAETRTARTPAKGGWLAGLPQREGEPGLGRAPPQHRCGCRGKAALQRTARGHACGRSTTTPPGGSALAQHDVATREGYGCTCARAERLGLGARPYPCVASPHNRAMAGEGREVAIGRQGLQSLAQHASAPGTLRPYGGFCRKVTFSRFWQSVSH